MERTEALEAFFSYVWREACDRCEIDTCDIQEKALALGLAVKDTYDPDRHGEMECEPGDEIYVRSDPKRVSANSTTANKGE